MTLLRIGAVALCIFLTSCTSEQLAAWSGHLEQIRAELFTVAGGRGPTASQLARLRHCESRGNYRAVSRSGRYRGAYQFSRSTWNATARRHLPHYVGVDPAQAAPEVQDAMARALWATGGRGHWPICGRRA